MLRLSLLYLLPLALCIPPPLNSPSVYDWLKSNQNDTDHLHEETLHHLIEVVLEVTCGDSTNQQCTAGQAGEAILQKVGVGEEVTQAQFYDVSLYTLYVVKNCSVCDANQLPAKDQVPQLLTGIAVFTEDAASALVEVVENRYNRTAAEEHKEDGHEEHGEHEEHDEGHSEEEGHDEEEGDGHDHRRKRATDGDEEHEGEHGHEEHGHEEHGELEELLCISGELVYHWSEGSGDNITQYSHASAWLVYAMHEAFHIEDHCESEHLPEVADLIDDIYHLQHADNHRLDEHDIESLQVKLSVGQHNEAGHTDEHNHRRRRSPATTRQCLSAAQMQLIVGGVPHVLAPQMSGLSSALVQQQLWGGCVSNATSEPSTVTDAQKFGYGSLAVFIISLAAVAGIIIVPCLKGRAYTIVMSIMIALAVGTLVGDSLLHLLPHSYGLHAHEEGHDHSSDEVVIEPFIWKSLAALGSLFAFFIIQSVMGLFSSNETSRGHGHSHGGRHGLANGEKNQGFDDIGDMSEAENGKSEYSLTSQYGSDKVLVKSDELCCNGVTSLALLISVGDGLHNFVDGLAIGAAFSSSVSLGISTSIAVLCHELPHELGDLAVLISTGLSVKRALCFNIVSALVCFVGLYVGLLIAVEDSVAEWIFTVTAGMFLYLGLVGMLPELLALQHSAQKKGTSAGVLILCQSVGMLLGFGIMFVIAIFEEKLNNAL